MSFEDDEESFEHTLLVVREVSVYKIPPRSTSGGYKCGEWLQSDKIWSGRLRVVSCNTRCEIRLEDPNSGELFAACFINPGQRESSVEPALDSSRYFVLKIEDGTGKHAFIGLGFNERNEAFDFNVALSDHEKYVRREHEKETAGAAGEGGDDSHIDIHPAVNHRLKEGETIRINVKNKSSSGTGMLSAAGLSSGNPGTVKAKTLSLAPPPSGGVRIRSPLPPPPNDSGAARMTSGSHNTTLKGPKEVARHSADPLADLSQLEVSSLHSVTFWNFIYPSIQFRQRKYVYQEALLLEVSRGLNHSILQSRKLRPANLRELPSRRIIDHRVTGAIVRIGIKDSSETI